MSDGARSVTILKGYSPVDPVPSKAEMREVHPDLMLIPFNNETERYVIALAKEGYLPAQIAAVTGYSITKCRRAIRKWSPYVPEAETTARRKLIDRLRETSERFLDQLSYMHAEKPGEAARVVGELVRAARAEEREMTQQVTVEPSAALAQSLQLLRGISGPLPAERLPPASPAQDPVEDKEELPVPDGFV